MLHNPNTQKSGNQPSHLVYHVEERGDNNQDIWTRIGAMWPHKDGKGFNLQLQFLPVNSSGKLAIRLNEPKEEKFAA
jgi:hypothetical protein